MPKWFTCAPERFKGDESFFWRDSGLLCRGLQKLGHESRVILPGPAFPEDLPDILRADVGQLQSPGWWRGLKIDGVIMVAWARHRDTPIVQAISESGTRLILHLDAIGDHFPLFNQLEGLRTFWRAEHDGGGGRLAKTMRWLKHAGAEGTKRLIKHTYLKYRHLKFATVVTCQTPVSVEGNLRLCRFFGGKNHGVDVRLIGYPISDEFVWDPAASKEKRVIAIGRWDDLKQKRPGVLMSVCAELARRDPDVGIDIFGLKTAALQKWHLELPTQIKARIDLRGQQPASIVARAMQRAQISFFPSSFEGGPQALFESLSCGCTSVALDSPFLPGHRWAAEEQHADRTMEDTTDAYVQTVEQALAKWQSGAYEPGFISGFWSKRTRVGSVLKAMLALMKRF